MCGRIKVWKGEKLIKQAAVVGVSHFGVVRDYMVELDSGKTLELSADLVQCIVRHEAEEKVEEEVEAMKRSGVKEQIVGRGGEVD